VRHPRLTARPGRGPSGGTGAGNPAGEAPPLVAVAHGSRDPRAAATVSELLGAVRALAPALDVRAAFLDHCAPALPQVLGALDGRAAVVVPLLLTAAYHSKTDIPAQLAAAPAVDAACAAALGPHPLLLTALERRLAEAGVPVHDAAERAATSVVLAAAGSSDPAARSVIEAMAARWAAERGWRVVLPAYASAEGPRPEQAVAACSGRVAVATYLLSPGYFADKVRDAALAAGAAAVAPVLGAAPEVARVVLERYAAATLDVLGAGTDLADLVL
jgi:sirohydrochlorin ferrochelatase